MAVCSSQNCTQTQFFFKVTESILAMVALGIFRGAMFQGSDPVVNGNYDFIFLFSAAVIGIGVITFTYVIGYLIGHQATKQERNFNAYAAIMYIIAGSWLIARANGALDIHPDYPLALRFVCGCFCLVLGVFFGIDLIVIARDLQASTSASPYDF